MNTLKKTTNYRRDNLFNTQPLRGQRTVGEILRYNREGYSRTITEMAKKLKINEKYLDALEQGMYNQLPSPVYIKNYLRLYARALDIPWARIEKLYAQEIRVYTNTIEPLPTAKDQRNGSQFRSRKQKSSSPQTSSSTHDHSPLVIPRLLKFGIAGLVIVAFTVYFAWGVLRLISPPDLTITSPETDIIVTEQQITIMGVTEPEISVFVNGQQVAVGPNGKFSEVVTLRPGLNTLRVIAQSKLSRERVEIRNILYNEGEE